MGAIKGLLRRIVVTVTLGIVSLVALFVLDMLLLEREASEPDDRG